MSSSFTAFKLSRRQGLFLCVAIAFIQISCDSSRTSLEKTCSSRNTEACVSLAEMMLTGEGGPKSRKNARLSFEKACRFGDTKSCRTAGKLAYAREGMDPLSRRHLKRACEEENHNACVEYAWMLQFGEGGEKKPNKAAQLLEDACDEKNPDGCFFAGLFAKMNDNTEKKNTF